MAAVRVGGGQVAPPYKVHRLILAPTLHVDLDLHVRFLFMLLIFVLTDANEATYSIEFGSNFSL